MNGEHETQQRQDQEGKPVREARKVGTSEKVMCSDASVEVFEGDKAAAYANAASGSRGETVRDEGMRWQSCAMTALRPNETGFCCNATARSFSCSRYPGRIVSSNPGLDRDLAPPLRRRRWCAPEKSAPFSDWPIGNVQPWPRRGPPSPAVAMSLGDRDVPRPRYLRVARAR